ncbi:hypothetical protein COOONC_15629 [Cooperia oncophora]
MNRSMQEEFTELTSLNSSNFSRSDDSTRHRPPISAPFAKPISAVYARSPARDVTNTTSLAYTGPATADTILCDEVEHLERDLTDFSLSSLTDIVDDTRPLITGNGKPPSQPKTTGSASSSSTPSPNSIRLMTAEELQRWHEKETREHKKAQSHLSSGRRKEPLPDGPIVDDEKSFSANLAARQTKETPADWTVAAQEAYKLLVECGRDLTNTPSPNGSQSSKINQQNQHHQCPLVQPLLPHVKARESSVESTVSTQLTEDVTSYSPQKRVHVIETKLLTTTAAEEEARLPPGLPPKFDQKPPPGRPPKTRNVSLWVGAVNRE